MLLCLSSGSKSLCLCNNDYPLSLSLCSISCSVMWFRWIMESLKEPTSTKKKNKNKNSSESGRGRRIALHTISVVSSQSIQALICSHVILIHLFTAAVWWDFTMCRHKRESAGRSGGQRLWRQSRRGELWSGQRNEWSENVCVRDCVRACVRACVRVCVCVNWCKC